MARCASARTGLRCDCACVESCTNQRGRNTSVFLKKKKREKVQKDTRIICDRDRWHASSRALRHSFTDNLGEVNFRLDDVLYSVFAIFLHGPRQKAGLSWF